MAKMQMVVPEGGGPPTVFPDKERRPFTIKLTPYGKAEFDRLRDLTGLSGSDLIELLLRKFGRKVQMVELIPPETARTRREKA